jgi:hypothetical protein
VTNEQQWWIRRTSRAPVQLEVQGYGVRKPVESYAEAKRFILLRGPMIERQFKARQKGKTNGSS